MITIGKIPQKVKTFFKPTKNNVSAHVYSYYCNLVIAICISHGSTIDRLVKLLRNSTHRTNHGEFLWRSEFGEMDVVKDQAGGILKRLYKKGCKDCLLIIDDTQTIKRAKKMQAVGKIQDISSRFPANWDKLVKEYNSRDYPLALGGYPHGFFGTLSHLIGYENTFVWYALDPELIHDILDTFTNIWITVYEQVLSQVEIDHLQIWEDISFGKGPMISPAMVKEFMNPYIKRVVDFLKTKGVKIFLLDTDGDCNSIIPVLMEAGVTGMYPFEYHCGMDVAKVRKEYPNLQMLGGIPKSEIVKGPQRIDEILEPIKGVLETGGYVPFGDHFIPPDVDFENFDACVKSFYSQKSS